MNKKMLLIAPLALFAAACATTQSASNVPAETPESAGAAIAAAEVANGKAASVNNEWRDTAKLITDAKAAVEAKQYDKAVQLAREAEHQGNNAVAQQAAQQTAVQRF